MKTPALQYLKNPALQYSIHFHSPNPRLLAPFSTQSFLSKPITLLNKQIYSCDGPLTEEIDIVDICLQLTK